MTKKQYLYDENDNRPDSNIRQKPNLSRVIEALQTFDKAVLPSTIYYGLSGLGKSETEKIKPIWYQVKPDARHRILVDLKEASEGDFELDYRAIAWLALNDPNSQVRTAAVELLWEDESLEALSQLIKLAQSDENPQVRAAAVSELGRFILLGEYEEISQQEAQRAQETALQLWNNPHEPVDVRRRALEAIANSSHKIVPKAITEAYQSDDHAMQVSALFAMGRSCDDRWCDIVLKEIASHDPEIRYEAARAAGELALEEAVTPLGKLTIESEREIKYVAIWSLGEIGNQPALHILTALAEDAEENEDDDLLEAIEDAIANAELIGDLSLDFEFNEDE